MMHIQHPTSGLLRKVLRIEQGADGEDFDTINGCGFQLLTAHYETDEDRIPVLASAAERRSVQW